MTRRLSAAAFCVLFAFLFQSCKGDAATSNDLINDELRLERGRDSLQRVRDSLAEVAGRISYTVQVVDGGKAAFASAGAGPDGDPSFNDVGTGVEVRVAQLGVIVTATTDAKGMVVFPDMRIGKVAVNISGTGYTSASYTADLTPGEPDPDGLLKNRHAATRIPVFPLTGSGTTTVSGVISYEADLTNTTREPVPNGFTVSASINVDAAFLARYIESDDPEGMGRVLSISYGDAIVLGTTTAGAYSLTVPGTADGLSVSLNLADAVVNQSLLQATLNGQEVFGAQSVRTTFTQDATVVPSTIPAVRPAYVTFAAPSTTGINQPPEIAATATAVISSGRIVSANITNAGSGYTQAPQVVFNSATGSGATGTAVVTGGRITAITVTAPGTGYQDVAVVLTSTGTGATAVANVTYEVSQINVTSGGSDFQTVPTVSFAGGGGTGATARANVLDYVNTITVSNGGGNFTLVPTVEVHGGGGSGATATANLNSSVQSITVPASVFFTVAPTVVIAGNGTGATATSALVATGRVTALSLGAGGSGYTSAPTVSFSGGGGSGAAATATVSAGAVTGITLDSQGTGYTSVPTVTFTGGGGTGATATATSIEKNIAVTITNGGSGYTLLTTGSSVTFNGSTIAGTTLVVNRSIASISVTAQGANYTSTPTVTIIGDAIGAVASANMRSRVASITVTNRGSGYRSAPTVTVTGDGTGATATPVLDNGILAGITITNGGSGYTAAPNVILSGGGPPDEHAVVTATVTSGEVTGTTIVSAGRRYTAAPTVTILTFVSAATATGNFASGTVVAVNVTNPGRGYKGVPVIDFVSLTGSGAAAVAVLDAQGRIDRIDVTAAGSNYATAPTLNIVVPNAAIRAKGDVTVSSQGVVTGVVITVGGAGYSSAPTATITTSLTGIGSGATVEARVANGVVTSVVVTNGGSGYLAHNTPGNYFPLSTVAIPGLGYQFSQPSGASLILRSGVAVVNDIYLGTGKRSIVQ